MAEVAIVVNRMRDSITPDFLNIFLEKVYTLLLYTNLPSLKT